MLARIWFKALWAVVGPLTIAVAGLVAQDRPLSGALPTTKGKEPIAEQLLAQRDALLAFPAFAKAPWTFDYEVARARAKASGQPIFAYFTRSYAASPPCRTLESSTFCQPAFAEFGKEVVLFCHVTSHVESDKNPDLLREKGGRVFPFLALLDANGEVIATLSPAEASVEKFRAALQAAFAAEAVQTRLRDAAFDLLVAKHAIGGITLARAKELERAMGVVDAARRKVIDELLIQIEVSEVSNAVRYNDDAIAAGQRFALMWKEGRVPTGVPARNFFAMILEATEHGNDPDTFAKALEEYRKLVDGKRNAAGVLRGFELRLQKLRERTKDQ